ncbi:MAG: acylphosphatase [Thermoprotei archaeon]|nr:MAG: acylphosphatase [Thermoprotei archaeon]
MKRIHAYVKGIVQGVGFRYFVYRHAKTLDLTGYVRNLPDGRVEVVAEGSEESLRELVSLLWEGPVGSYVENVELEWSEAKNEFKDFKIIW